MSFLFSLYGLGCMTYSSSELSSETMNLIENC